MSYGKSYYQIRQEIEQAEGQSAGETAASSGETQAPEEKEKEPAQTYQAEKAPDKPDKEDASEMPTEKPGIRTGIGDHSADVGDFIRSAGDAGGDAAVLPPDALAVFFREEEQPVETLPEKPEEETVPESDSSGEEPYDGKEDDTAIRPGVSGYRKQEKSVATVSVRQESGSYQRGVPHSLAIVAKSMFPMVGFEKAVAAYIYLREGCPKDMDVPEDIRAMALEKGKEEKQLSNSDMQKTLLAKISSLENRLKGMQQNLDTLTFLTAYIQYDRDGFTGERPKTIQDVRFGIPLEYLDKMETDFKNAATLRENRRKRLKY